MEKWAVGRKLKTGGHNKMFVNKKSYSPKSGFTIIEVVVVFLLILGVTFLILPKSLNNTKQARFISKWSTKYSELEYMYTVIKAQQDGEYLKEFTKPKKGIPNNCVIPDLFKPYLRIISEVQPCEYQQYYMNHKLVQVNDKYYFNKYYLTGDDEILSLKWLKESCTDNTSVCAIMAFDMNGKEPPNTWGYDIFGINLYKNNLDATGKGISPDILRNDCSKEGYGIYCSYYYLMGGRFD